MTAVRESARATLRATTLADLRQTTLVDDGVSEALARSLNRAHQAELDPLTVGDLTKRLFSPEATQWVRRYRDGLTSEAIAAAAKVMTNDELSFVARSIFNALPGEGVAVGSPPHFGSRIQPNSPGDDEDEILFSILEGLSYGCGDVIIGLNPASDDVDTIIRLEELLQRVVQRLELPTRYCVLSDLPSSTRRANVLPSMSGFKVLPARRGRLPAWSVSTSTAFSTSHEASRACTSRPVKDPQSPTAPPRASTWSHWRRERTAWLDTSVSKPARG